MTEQEGHETQDETPDTIGRNPGGFWNFVLRSYCWILILGTLYVLSIGPMYWHWYDTQYTGEGSRAVQAFYVPLAIACENIGPLDNWVQWYIGLWT